MSHPPKAGFSDNSIGAIAYLTPFMAFFFLAIRRYNKRPFVRFHAWQSLVFSAYTFIFGCIVDLIAPFIIALGPRAYAVLVCLLCLMGLVVFLLWLWCVFSAMNGKRFKLPIIGDWADEQAYR